jgi:hypothetical protein
MAGIRYYLIERGEVREGGTVKVQRLVQAPNPSAALRHVAQSVYTVKVASQQDVVDVMTAGVKPEVAGAEPEPDPDE